MEVKLDVLISTCIKQRKPWPRISWVGQEKEAVFLLDGKRINEINLASGKTKKKIPSLQSLLKNVVVLTTSGNAAWLAGILTTGELFLWNKDRDYLKIVPAIEESKKVVAAAEECSMKLYLYVSGDGRKVLLTTPTACVFLWESTEHKNTASCKNSSGRWTQILPDESVILPSTEEKETGVHAAFIQNEVLGDCCLSAFVFYSGDCLVLTFLILRWHESAFKNVSSLPYQIQWVQQTCSLVNLVPQCVSVKSRGALLCAFAGDGLLLAVAVNQTNPKATQVLFLNTLNFVTVSGSLRGCSSKSSMTPSRFIRSYWVGDMCWTPDSLFLACMLKRGSLILLTCMGELLTLIASGCSVEFGPAQFIPFHPLITYRQHRSFCQDSSQSLGSSDSECDLMRQRFSVASHPRLPYLIVSDGYMITLLRFPNNFSPSGFIRSLLLDSTQQLENIHQNLLNFKSKGRSWYLRSLMSLKASLLKQVQNQSSIFSTIPRFLEEDTTEMNEKTMDLLVLNGIFPLTIVKLHKFKDHEEESDNEKQFCNNPSSFYNQRIHSFVSKADQGCLEFASMFDTIHAEDDIEEKDKSSLELYSIQKNLLGAWQIGISKNTEEKDVLLNYTVNCIIHFFSIVQFVKCTLLNQDASSNKSVKNTQWMHCVLKYFQQCLTVLYWHSRASVTGHVAKLTLETLKLMLIQRQDQLFSKNLLACFCLLKMVSHTLSRVCVIQYENFFSSPDSNILVELDSLTVPVFLVLDDSTTQQFSSLKSLLREPPQVNRDTETEKRLTVLWRLLYKKVLWYQVQLKRKVNKNAKEASVVSLLLSHIQATIQSSGVTLEQHLKMNSISGEEQFLLGSYRESVDIWKRSLCELKIKGGKRACFLQRRYYLAILFCHLYQYNISEAQGLCDHLVREILRRSQLSTSQMEKFSDTKYFQHELWMVTSIHTDTAMAVIRSMARFMAAYFTKQLLYIFPPHNVDILHPLHIKQDLPPRVIPLQYCLVTRAVGDQNLSSVWTPEYALDLFFIGGLIPEAVWLAHTLGDWKLSVSIGLAYKLYCQNSDELSRLKKAECHLPLSLLPMQTFQEKLQSLLGQPVTSEPSGHIKYKKFTDPIEEEDADVLYNKIQELLKAAVMADVDILSETFQLLMDSAKDLCRKFYGLVPVGLYLPAPPLYCPQPASLSEEDSDGILLKMEKEVRQKVSGVLQRIILLLRAARCSCSAAQWYIRQLKWARKVMQKIRMKGSLPSLSPFPETLLRYCSFRTVLCGSTSSGRHQFDDMTCKILGWFREFCALCWMFHVREKLSDNCRRYQTARENINNIKDLNKNGYDVSTVEHCLNAVEWACRMLPFCRFMNVEELVQDVILSLLGELPPIKKVAEIFVKAFPNPEDIRVSLRDKYHGLQERLSHSIVKVGPENEEMMSVVIQAAEEVRKKALRRVVKNIGPIEINIWEPVEEGASNDEEHCYDRFSLGTSLSTSTLTDLGNPQIYSDTDTADTLSNALFTEETRAQTPSFPRDNELQRQREIGSKNTTHKIKAPNCKTKHKVCQRDMLNPCNLPVVGAWEFERDDDEYVRFLELFLSYVLERDLIKYGELGIPFLTSFSGLLREHELNSLFFDVHTTLKRRQNKTRSQSVFSAGSCYTVTLASCDPEKVPACSESKNILEKPTIVQSIVQTTEPSVHNLMKGHQEGLFGLKYKSIYRAQTDNQEVTVALASQTFPKHTSSTLQTQATSKYIYKTLDVVGILPAEELPIELTGKLSNIAKLLEWMIRWSDKRLLCGSNKQDSLEEPLPMIHVKTSSAAVLSSFWLLEQLYGDRSLTKSFRCKHPDNQYLKEIASLSEAQSRTDKESSMDEGSSIVASSPPGVQNVQAYDDLCESDLGMSTKSKYFDKKEINHGNNSVPLMTEDLNEVGPFVQQELSVTPEQEFFEEPYETPKSSNSSVKIKPVEHQREQGAIPWDSTEQIPEEARLCSPEVKDTISAVDGPEDQNMEETKEKKAKQNIMTEVVTSTISHSLSSKQDAEVPSSADISVSDSQPSQTVVSTISSLASHTSVCAKKQEVKEKSSREEKPNASETVRQMLQDEMFKLVQLQQINFMSLMQIVQSSFTNVPNVQQMLPQHQSVHLAGSQPAHTAVSNAYPKTQVPTQEEKRKAGQESSVFQPRKSVKNGSSNGQIKNHLDMSASLTLFESNSKETGLMSPSQDLHSSVPTKPLHLLAPSSGIQKKIKLIPVEKKISYSNGFPLLKLESSYHAKPAFLHPIEMSSSFARPPPVPRVAWSSSDSLSYTPRKTKAGEDFHKNRYNPEIPRQMHEEKERWAERVHKGPPKYLNLDQYEGQQEVSPRPQFPANVDVYKAPTTQNLAGVPLLRLQFGPVPRIPPAVRQPITTTLIPVKPATKGTDSRKTLQDAGISLLQINLPEKKKAPKLIPLQDIIAFEQLQKHHSVPSTSFGQDQTKPMELLKTGVEPFELRDVQNNRKSKKRRNKKQLKEKEDKKKPNVSFHPDDSIISISDTAVVTESETGDHEPKSTSYVQNGFLISMDAMEKASTISADLHYLASVGKKPTETQDASTNTNPVLESYQDHGISRSGNEVSKVQKNELVTSVPASESSSSSVILLSDMYLNLSFPTEMKDKPLPSFLSDAPDLHKQEYISVIDIEDSDILNNLPMKPESTEEIAAAQQNEKLEIPSTAKLNHTAASVTNAIPPEALQKQGDHQKKVSNQLQKKDKKSDSATDSVTWNIAHEEGRTLPSSGLPSKVIEKEYFSTKQWEMDMQLQTLQNIIENMEQDFRNSKMLVKLIEDFERAADSDLGARLAVSEAAGVIGAEHHLTGMIFEEVTDDQKESLNLEYPVPSSTTVDVHSPASAALASNCPSGLKSPSDGEFSLGEEAVLFLPRQPYCSSVASSEFQASSECLDSSSSRVCRELCAGSSEDPMQITGLSDVTGMNDRVVESDISVLELGFAKTQAKKISRVLDSASGHSQRTEEERKEIQTWMKRKQKERMREYMKKRDEQRQKEHHPFNLRKNVHHNPTSKDIRIFQKKKEEKDKALLSEHHSIRISQALSLMNEMLSDTVASPASDHRTLSSTRSPQVYRRRDVASSTGGHLNSPVLAERSRIAAKPGFGQKVQRFTPALGLTESKGNACKLLQKSTSRRRLRNATNCPVNSRHSAECRVSRSSTQKPLQVATAVQTEGVDLDTDRDVVSPWTVPEDIQRILQDTHDSMFQASAVHGMSFSPLGSINMDSVSESTGSILSKLDWNAVEAMIADVEDK
ncbi:ciliogenesis and planar polarity effector 1 isoform X3 [Corvus moneduloides]|uniref:ciliogenesis and planar polarity effector 1 isoform X3 n=1 Tax=Corvus moneduloides TaxID=1196302 RepID=UPI00136203A0|nr:ciliogenesis and planar polarity effector 1 isoform X3 [Corvus moneduloides]